MRLLYITDALAVWGGIERVLRDKTTYLVSKYGYEIHFVTTNQGEHPLSFPVDERIHIHDLGINSHHQYRYHGFLRIIKYFELNELFLKRLKDIIGIIKPDLIICIRLEAIRVIIKAKGNIPLVFESHSIFSAFRYEHSSLWYRMRLHVAEWYLRKAACVVALTEGDAKDWRRYNKNVHVIPNVVQLNPTGVSSSLLSKNVIFVGRFTEQKDIGSLVEIWKVVHQRHPDWELHAYGEGEYKDHYDILTKELNIKMMVHNPTSHIFEKYVESSMLIMTSLYEPFGLVLPEAMSCGLPVVAFDCPYGPADIIHDGVDGFLVEDRNVEVFADRVCQLIESVQLRRHMGEHAVKSSQRYLADYIMPQWEFLFRQIVRKVGEKDN